MKPEIKIAVIDDGVSKIAFEDLHFDFEVDGRQNVKQRVKKQIKHDSHGTACAQIIKHYAPGAVIGSIKILDSKTHSGFVESLEAAVEWCLTNDVSLVNLSLGSTKSRDHKALKKIVDFSYDNGLIIVAASSNKDVVSYPASFANVIGVSLDSALTEDLYYIVQPDIRGIDVYASSNHSSLELKSISGYGNSYAAPVVTAKVYDIMTTNYTSDIDKIKAELSKKTCKRKKGQTHNNQTLSRKLEIPCIVLLFASADCQKIISELNEFFYTNEYNTLALSTIKYGDCDNILQLSQSELNDSAISNIRCMFDTDIILLGIAESDLTQDVKISSDILFSEKENYSSELLLFEKQILFHIENNNVVEDIYTKIVDYLT